MDDMFKQLRRFLEIDSPHCDYPAAIDLDLSQGQLLIHTDDASHEYTALQDRSLLHPDRSFADKGLTACSSGAFPGAQQIHPVLALVEQEAPHSLPFDGICIGIRGRSTELLRVKQESKRPRKSIKQQLLNGVTNQIHHDSLTAPCQQRIGIPGGHTGNGKQDFCLPAYQHQSEFSDVDDGELDIDLKQNDLPPQKSIVYAFSLVKEDSDGKYWYDVSHEASVYAGRNAAWSEMPAPASWLVGWHWVPKLLIECARAISLRRTEDAYKLLHVINSMASPDAVDLDSRFAAYFAESLQHKVAGTGPSVQKTVYKAMQRVRVTFNAAISTTLMWREVSPWVAFGHVAANAAIMRAFENETHIHVVDISHWHNVCSQWPTFLESLATRPDGPPALFRLTIVIQYRVGRVVRLLKEAHKRLTSFARLNGVPFELHVVPKLDVDMLSPAAVGVRPNEPVAINLNQSLRGVSATPDLQHGGLSLRDMVLQRFASIKPRIITLTEDDVDQVASSFEDRFRDVFRFASVLMGSIDRPDIAGNEERLYVQERAVRLLTVKNIACDEDTRLDHEVPEYVEPLEKRETSDGWYARFHRVGLDPVPIAEDVIEDVQSLVNSYPSYIWSLRRSSHRPVPTPTNETAQPDTSYPSRPPGTTRLTLMWRDSTTVTFTAWCPSDSTEHGDDS